MDKNKSCVVINEELQLLHRLPIDALRGRIEGLDLARNKLLNHFGSYFSNPINDEHLASVIGIFEDIIKEMNTTQKVLSEREQESMLKRSRK